MTTKKRYFAAINKYNFANTWDVLAFDSKASRDKYVSDSDQRWVDNNLWDCRAIKKGEVTSYASNYNCTTNEYYKPKAFSTERWEIYNPFYNIKFHEGFLGYVEVGYGYNEPLFA